MRFNLSTFQTCRYQDKHTRLEIEANPPEVATERTIHKTPNLNINAQTALASPFRSQNERANMAIVLVEPLPHAPGTPPGKLPPLHR
jgi:hypothetical protein